MGQRVKRHRPSRAAEAIQENVHTGKKCIPQPSTIFQYPTRRERNAGRILEKAGGH